MKRTSRPRFFLLFLSIAVAPAFAEVYKTVDKDGNIIYTDVPQPGTSPVDLPPSSTYAPPSASPSPTPAPSTSSMTGGTPVDSSGPLVVYKSINITAPLSDAVFTPEAASSVVVSVAVEPSLGPADKVEFVLDGQSAAPASQNTQLTLSQLERGTHKVLARVVNANGAVLKKSAPVSFHVQQHVIKRAK